MAKTKEELISTFHEQFGMSNSERATRLYYKLYTKLSLLLVRNFEVIRFTSNGKFHLKQPVGLSAVETTARLLEVFDADKYLSITFTRKTIWVSYYPYQEKED